LTTLSGVSTYTGTTRVTGGILKLDGTNRIAAGSALDLSGGTLEVASAGPTVRPSRAWR
jgi:autotransporter-associated beta strand protein